MLELRIVAMRSDPAHDRGQKHPGLRQQCNGNKMIGRKLKEGQGKIMHRKLEAVMDTIIKNLFPFGSKLLYMNERDLANLAEPEVFDWHSGIMFSKLYKVIYLTSSTSNSGLCFLTEIIK